MPALVTHYLFGQEVLHTGTSFSKEILQEENLTQAFLLGCQGPDPFFFSLRSKGASDGRKFGSLLHRHHITQQFNAYKEALLYLKEADRAYGQAYLYGFLAHFQLDTITHPYIYAQQYALIGALNQELLGSDNCVHAVIESDIDSSLYALKHQEDLCKNGPHMVLKADKDCLRVAGLMHAYVAQKVYGLALLRSEFYSAVQDMRIIYRLIESPNGKRSALIGKLERIKKDHSLLASLSHRPASSKTDKHLNLEHKPWKNPYNQRESCQDFLELFNDAKELYLRNCAIFSSYNDISAISQCHNYNGAPLSLDETRVLSQIKD